MGGKGDLGRVTVGRDGAHVVAVRPVARKPGDGREIAWTGLASSNELLGKHARDAVRGQSVHRTFAAAE
jgi:hypothetical protein